MAQCPSCKKYFQVPEDEKPEDHGCFHCGFGTEPETDYPIEDYFGDEIQDGDHFIEINGDVVLECNLVDYVEDVLGARSRTAGKD